MCPPQHYTMDQFYFAPDRRIVCSFSCLASCLRLDTQTRDTKSPWPSQVCFGRTYTIRASQYHSIQLNLCLGYCSERHWLCFFPNSLQMSMVEIMLFYALGTGSDSRLV